METSSDLLNEFSAKDEEREKILEYRKTYSILRIISWVILAFSLVVYLFIYFDTYSVTKTSLKPAWVVALYIITMLLMTGIPSALMALVLAAFINTSLPYKERYKKSYWIFMVGMTSFYTIGVTISYVSAQGWFKF